MQRGARAHRCLRLLRSGEPGIAAEWVLRMPVGKTFDMRPRPLLTHDILDKQPRRLGIGSVRDGERWVQRPANIRVTLVEVCAADVRVGAVTDLEISSSHIPFPTGFRTSRWVQLDGCGKLLPFPPPPEASPVHIEPEIPEPPDLAAIVVHRETGSGHAALRVDEAWLQKHNKPVVFHVTGICRYDAAAGGSAFPSPIRAGRPGSCRCRPKMRAGGTAWPWSCRRKPRSSGCSGASRTSSTDPRAASATAMRW